MRMYRGAFAMALLTFLAGAVTASAAESTGSCVSCHTDASVLKAITDSLPKPAKSEETAGKG